MAKILMIVGSLRKNSFNRQLANIISDLISNRAQTSFLEYADIPYLNQDIEFPTPDPILRIRNKVNESDGIWIVTPEYNHCIPGVLKNLLDWLSRPVEKGGVPVVINKPVTFCGVAGMSGSACVQDQMLFLLNFMRMNVIKTPRTCVALQPQEMGKEKLNLSENSLNTAKAQVDAFLKALEKNDVV